MSGLIVVMSQHHHRSGFSQYWLPSRPSWLSWFSIQHAKMRNRRLKWIKKWWWLVIMAKNLLCAVVVVFRWVLRLFFIWFNEFRFYFDLSCWEHTLRPNLVLGNHICCVSWYCWIVTSSVESLSSALASRKGLERRSIDVVDLDAIVELSPEIRFTFVSSTPKLTRKSMGENFRLSHKAHCIQLRAKFMKILPIQMKIYINFHFKYFTWKRSVFYFYSPPLFLYD